MMSNLKNKKMTGVNPTIPIIALNVSGLKNPT